MGCPILGRMDLKRMVADLQGWGLTQQQIGDAIGRSQSTVSDLAKSAKRPTLETAERLRRLHERTKRERMAA